MAARHNGSGDRSPEEIRREIERTRSHMDEAVEAIGEKLSPGRFVDDLWLRLQKDGAAAVASSLRDHPIPFALVSAGLGWLVMEQARARTDVGTGTYERAEGRVGPYRGDAVDHDDPEWEHAGMGAKVKGKVADAAHAVTEKLSDAAGSVRHMAEDGGHAAAGVGHRMQETAHAAGEKVAHAAHAAGEKAVQAGRAVGDGVSSAAGAAAKGARRGVEKTRDGFSQLLEQNPMALGAIAFGLGVASGVSAPTTRWEDEKLGRYAGPLKDEAKRTVKETAQKVKGVARDAFDAAKGEFEHQREEVVHGDPIQMAVNQLKESARAVGRAATDAARERASTEELTAEGMKNLAKRARDQVGGTAGD